MEAVTANNSYHVKVNIDKYTVNDSGVNLLLNDAELKINFLEDLILEFAFDEDDKKDVELYFEEKGDNVLRLHIISKKHTTSFGFVNPIEIGIDDNVHYYFTCWVEKLNKKIKRITWEILTSEEA